MKEKKIPEWMEHYREMFINTGGLTIEDLLNRLKTQPNLSRTNLFVFTMATSVEAQFLFLRELHKRGLLVEPEHTFNDSGKCVVCGAQHYSLDKSQRRVMTCTLTEEEAAAFMKLKPDWYLTRRTAMAHGVAVFPEDGLKYDEASRTITVTPKGAA